LSETGCRGVAGSSCGAPQEAHFGGAPRYTSINARAAPAGPPGRVVDARIAHRAPNGQTSPKNEKISGTPAKTCAARLARRGNPNPRLSPPTDLRSHGEHRRSRAVLSIDIVYRGVRCPYRLIGGSGAHDRSVRCSLWGGGQVLIMGAQVPNIQ